MKRVNKISKTVKNRRNELHLTQTDLADKTGLKQAQIARFENGQTNVRTTTLLQILQGLDLELVVKNKD